MRAWVLLVLAACAHGGGENNGSDATAETLPDAKTGDAGCLFACEPPAPACLDACNEVTQAASGCEAGVCVFEKTKRACELGCDSATGRCADVSVACLKKACGAHACGGTCGAGSGCCTEKIYDKTTGLTTSGTKTCCDPGDELVDATDCGTGVNHGINKDGVCASCWEGAGNGGSPCAAVKCRKRTCP